MPNWYSGFSSDISGPSSNWGPTTPGAVRVGTPWSYYGKGVPSYGFPPTPKPEETYNIPQYFTKPPVGMNQLSPLAQLYLSQIFPPTTESQQTTPYQAATQLGQTVVNPQTGMTEPAAPTEEQMTAKSQFTMPSAQLWQRMMAAGAIPALQSYAQDVLGVPWESIQGEMQAFWPSQQKVKSAQWQTARQK